MIRFKCRTQVHLVVKKGDMWQTIKFVQRKDCYFYDCFDEEVAKQIQGYSLFEEGKIWREDVEEREYRPEPVTELGRQRKADTEAKRANKEVVVGVASCSDARAFLRERFPDEDVMLRSKREILEYAERKNIHFSEL